MRGTRRFSRITTGLIFLIVATISLTVLGLLYFNAQANEPPDDGPESMGIRYGTPKVDFKPAISTEKAIEIAKARIGWPQEPLTVEENIQIEANLVLFSNDQLCAENEGGEKNCFYQDIPAWVVTFSNIKFYLPSDGGRANKNLGPVYNTEVHVAIDAVTGNVLELYSYK